MRRILLAAMLCALSLGPSRAGQMPPMTQTQFTDEQKADLDRVSAYLNGMHTLQGGFTQIDPNGGIDEGTLYIEKPGRMRFEYRPPNPILVVSDGSTVAVKNSRLNTVDRYPLWTTPLDLLLSDRINLRHNSIIVGVEHQQGMLVIQARSHSKSAQGSITMVFADPELELRQWTVVDAQGLSTTVALRDVKQGVDLAPSLFVLDEKNKFTKDSGD